MNRTATKLSELDRVLNGCKKMTILTHDYPDPDSIASAMLLSYLLKNKFNIVSNVVFGGQVLRAENQSMIKLLKIKITHINRIRVDKLKYTALVDTQKDFTNHSLPKSVIPLLVFDHHQQTKNNNELFTDIRENYGATATILYEYIKTIGLEIPIPIATAVSYAIRSETQDLGREASQIDIETYLDVYSKANKKILSRINHPKLSREYFSILYLALQNAKQYKNMIHIHLGFIDSPEFVSQIADILLQHERISWTIVTGRINNQLYVSLRSTNIDKNIGKLLQNVIGRRGFAGGHRMIAGGRINLENPDEQEWQTIEKSVISKFLKKMRYEKEVPWRPLVNHNISE